MRDLLAHGASTAISCPLHIATSKDRPDLVALLLDHGADVNAVIQVEIGRGASRKVNPYRRAALHEAAKVGSLECVKVLLEQGADPTLQDSNGDVPWEKVQDQEGECCKRLRKAAEEWEGGGR